MNSPFLPHAQRILGKKASSAQVFHGRTEKFESTRDLEIYNKYSMTDRFSVSFPSHSSVATGRSGSHEHSIRFINSCKCSRASFHSCRETDCSEKVPAGRTRSQHRPKESKAHSKWISILLIVVEDPDVCFFNCALRVGGITKVAVCRSRLSR